MARRHRTASMDVADGRDRPSRPGWRGCSTTSRSWSSSACCRRCGLLLVFLTYPLGLGIWLAFTDTTIGRAGQFVGLENFEYLLDDPHLLERGLQHVFYTGRRDRREIRARPVAGAAAEQPPAVQGAAARHHPAALDRADGAVGDRLLVDLRPAVLDHLLRARRRAALARPPTSTSWAPPGRRAGR